MADGTVRRIGEALGWSVTAGVGVVLATQAIGWDGSSLIAVLQALTPIGLVSVIAVAIGAALARSRRLTITSTLVLLGLLVLAAPIAFDDEKPPASPDTVGVSIASLNLLYDNPTIEELADDLLVRAPDVIAFSEYTQWHRRKLDRHPLADRYPHRIDLDASFGSGMAVWSIHPIIDRGPLDDGARAVDVTIDGPDGPIRILAVHPRTPISDFDAWRTALQRVGDRAQNSPEPTVLVGDFNASYWHPAYRRLIRSGLTDAHIAAGDGWSTSWPIGKLIPSFVRLDHALTNDRLTVSDLIDFDPPGSDHRAFMVTVAPAQISSAR